MRAGTSTFVSICLKTQYVDDNNKCDKIKQADIVMTKKRTYDINNNEIGYW